MTAVGIPLNKFGLASDADQGIATDVWDGADGTTSTDVWVAPTAARVHAIASTSVNDAAAGSGMRTVRVYGLQTWDSFETSEDITLAGSDSVNTSNSYVIIHRMKGLTFGAGGANDGKITATAASDSTVTAVIQNGNNQTLMAIYGVPSVQVLYLKQLVQTSLRVVATVQVDGTLLINERADQSDSGFLVKERYQTTQDAPFVRTWSPPKTVVGPAIVKMQANSSANNATVTGAFDGYLQDRTRR
jgi:hypothetical protein